MQKLDQCGLGGGYKIFHRLCHFGAQRRIWDGWPVRQSGPHDKMCAFHLRYPTGYGAKHQPVTRLWPINLRHGARRGRRT